MEEKELNEIIVVKQLPEIKEQLQLISNEVDKEIEYALSLEVNEDSVKEVKNVRARLNKINTALENKRKYVKEAILTPYNDFLEVYDKLVKNKLNEADSTLKMRINTIEEEQKKLKEEELREFANQYIEANNIENILSFDDIPLNITLSASMKSLKEEIKRFVEEISNDIELINLEEYSDEILLEYKKTFDFTKSKLNVIERHKQLEELQKQQEIKQEQEKQEEKVVEKVEKITAPKEIIEDDDIVEVQFKIKNVLFNAKGTKKQFKEVKEYFKMLGVEYE